MQWKKGTTIWDTFVLGLISFISSVTSVDLDFICKLRLNDLTLPGMEVTVFLNLEIHGPSEGKIYLQLSLDITRCTSQKLEHSRVNTNR